MVYWPKALDNIGVDHYNVYIGLCTGDDLSIMELIGEVDGEETEPRFELVKLQPDTSYIVQVEAVDKAGNISQALERIFNTLKVYTVTFDSQGGSKIPEKIVDENENLDEKQLEIPEKDGFIFEGWYKEANCINPWNFEDSVTKDITLYAKWSINDDNDKEDPENPEDLEGPKDKKDPKNPKDSEDTKDPKNTKETNKDELPKTGEVTSLVYYLVGLILVILGIIFRRKRPAL